MTASQSQFEFGSIGSAPAAQALSEIPMAMASGVDHLSALADALGSDRTLGFPFATLARGAMEAYGRAWYLLEAPDAKALVQRWLATRINDLKFAVRASDDPAEEAQLQNTLDSLRNDAAALGMPRSDMKVSFTALASAVHDAAYSDTDGGREYSILSAVAHAERSGIQRLVHRQAHDVARGLHSAELKASDEYIHYVMHTAVALHAFLFSSALGCFGLSPLDQKEWGESFAAVLSRISE